MAWTKLRHSSAQDVCERKGRRALLKGGALAVLGGLSGPSMAARVTAHRDDPVLEAISRHKSPRILLRGGTVLSLDPAVGNFTQADVLMEGTKILDVKPNISAPAIVLDAAGYIVMPGFVDTHHHQYETALRSILADGLLRSTPDMPTSYSSLIQKVFTPLYLPEDAYISQLVASLSQINNGVTTTVDTSQVNNSPGHTDAMIDGLLEAGHRAVFAYSSGYGPDTQFPQDITRIQRRYFSSADQLVTLALATNVNLDHWVLARSLGVPIVSHIVGTTPGTIESLRRAAAAGAMHADNEYIHCSELPEDLWTAIADTGGKVSVAPAIEMQMRHGLPPIQKALDRKIELGLSVDVECSMTADLFTVMRTAFTLQRGFINQRVIEGERDVPPLLGTYDTIKLATRGGASVANLQGKVGSLTPGKEADIVLLDARRLNVFPLNNVPGAVVTLMDTANVAHVFIAGRLRKWKGALVGVDVDNLRRRIERASDDLLGRAKVSRSLFDSCCLTSESAS